MYVLDNDSVYHRLMAHSHLSRHSKLKIVGNLLTTLAPQQSLTLIKKKKK